MKLGNLLDLLKETKNLENYDVIWIEDEKGNQLLTEYQNYDKEIPVFAIIGLTEEQKNREVKSYSCDFGEIYIKLKN